MMQITISRFGSGTQTVSVPEGSTVQYVLEDAGIELDANSRLHVDGVTAQMNNVLEDGDIVTISTPKQAG